MKSVLGKITDSRGGYATLMLRVVAGIIFMTHSGQKLLGLPGEYGLGGVGQAMMPIGLESSVLTTSLMTSGEFLGGLFILLGLFTRLAALLSAIAIIAIIFSARLVTGLFMSHSGYEYALTLLAASILLTIFGSGKLSLDNYIRKLLQ